MRTTEPSPGRLFQYVSSQSFRYIFTGWRCMQSKTRTKVLYLLLFNDKHSQVREKPQKRVYSDLHMYEAFYFGEENEETITWKNISCFKPVIQLWEPFFSDCMSFKTRTDVWHILIFIEKHNTIKEETTMQVQHNTPDKCVDIIEKIRLVCIWSTLHWQ
jgi:hypothetical protein